MPGTFSKYLRQPETEILCVCLPDDKGLENKQYIDN